MPESIVIDWVTSYLVGSIPTLKDMLSKQIDLKNRIEACYQSALKKWCLNTSIRDSIFEKFTLIGSLQAYILSKQDHKEYGIDLLLHLWADELRKDDTCYKFILETKIDNVKDSVDDISLAVKR